MSRVRAECSGIWLAPHRAVGCIWRRGGPRLSLLIALAALAVLARAALGITALGIAALGVGSAAALARRKIGTGCGIVLTDEDLGAVGKVGKPRRHHAVGSRQPAGDDRVILVLLRHHDRFCRGDIARA